MVGIGWLGALLAATVVLLYTLVYTPLKRRSTACTLVGAVCGAIPPMIGWAGACGRIDVGAWLLGAVLFLWQIPHFFSLAWLYRRDYARGGFRILPVVDRTGDLTCRALLLFGLLLLPLGLTVSLAGLAGPGFAFGSLILGGGWLLFNARMFRDRSAANARRVFVASLLYLPLLLGLMVADRVTPDSAKPWGTWPRGPMARSVADTPPEDIRNTLEGNVGDM
jgi:protoheme IX farnesyltransferase